MKKIIYLFVSISTIFICSCSSSKNSLSYNKLKTSGYPYSYVDTSVYKSEINIYGLRVLELPTPTTNILYYFSIFKNNVQLIDIIIDSKGVINSIHLINDTIEKLNSLIIYDNYGNIKYIKSYFEQALDGYVFRFDKKKLCGVYFISNNKFKKNIFFRINKYEIKYQDDVNPLYLK